MSGDKDKLTPDELIATIQHSSLPTVIVEGIDDMSLFRQLERELDCDILSCGGRTDLFNIFNHRDLFIDKKCVFLADRDMYVFEGIPKEYEAIVFTRGYSIENDILYGTQLKKALSLDAQEKFNKIRDELIKWWAIEVSLYKVLPEFCSFSKSIYEIFSNIDEDSPRIEVEYPAGVLESLDNVELIQEMISEDFDRMARGHHLHQIYCRLLTENKNPKYRRLAGCLLTACVTLENPPLYLDLIEKVKNAFDVTN